MFALASMQLHNRVDAQPTKRWKGYAVYTILNLECCKCARMILHCANIPVLLRSCPPGREHRSQSGCGQGYSQQMRLRADSGQTFSVRNVSSLVIHFVMRCRPSFSIVRELEQRRFNAPTGWTRINCLHQAQYFCDCVMLFKKRASCLRCICFAATAWCSKWTFTGV